jgi:FAD/FMN-containing dehydrogenase
MLATSLTGMVELPERAVDAFGRRLSGALLRPGADGYDDARAVWNRLIDRRPALIARCAGVDDVVHAMQFAREHALLVSVRGGGHNVAGSAVCAGGLMIDGSLMKETRVDPERRLLVAAAGLTWGELDRATQPFGLATTGGIVSTTGVAGLTLGGGHGWLMRRHGLTCDNLVAAHLVTADGRRIMASAGEHPDLFWAIRGGGGNFGIVTAFEFRLHPVTTVLAGLLVFPMSRGRDVLRAYRDVAGHAADELSLYVVITVWPDGTPVIAVVPCWLGAVDEGERAIAPLRRLPGAIVDDVRPRPYAELQTMFDATNPPGAWYYKSGYFAAGRTLDDDVVDVLLAQSDFATPTMLSRIVIEQLGGAIARVAPDETAFFHRASSFDLIVIAGGFAREDAPRNIRWARTAWTAMRPFLSGGVYVNYLDADQGADGVRAAYGPVYDRLAAVKAAYDPGNVFRLNQNIAPR